MEQLSRALERIAVPELEPKDELNLLGEQKPAKEEELLDKLESASSTLEANPAQSLQPSCDPEKILEALLVEKEKEVEELKAENERLKGKLRHQENQMNQNRANQMNQANQENQTNQENQANQAEAKSESAAFTSASSHEEEMSVGADKRLE